MPKKKYEKYLCLTKIEHGFLYYFSREFLKNSNHTEMQKIYRSLKNIQLDFQENERNSLSNYFFQKNKHTTKWLRYHYKTIALQHSFFNALKNHVLYLRDIVIQNALGEISEYKSHIRILEQKNMLEEYPYDFPADDKYIMHYLKFLRSSRQILDSQIFTLNLIEQNINAINETADERIQQLNDKEPLYHYKLNLLLQKYHEDYGVYTANMPKIIAYLTTNTIIAYANNAAGLTKIFRDMANGLKFPPPPRVPMPNYAEKTERIRDVTELELEVIRRVYLGHRRPAT